MSSGGGNHFDDDELYGEVHDQFGAETLRGMVASLGTAQLPGGDQVAEPRDDIEFAELPAALAPPMHARHGAPLGWVTNATINHRATKVAKEAESLPCSCVNCVRRSHPYLGIGPPFSTHPAYDEEWLKANGYAGLYVPVKVVEKEVPSAGVLGDEDRTEVPGGDDAEGGGGPIEDSELPEHRAGGEEPLPSTGSGDGDDSPPAEEDEREVD